MEKNYEYIEGPRAGLEALKYNIPVYKIYIFKNIDLKSNRKIEKLIKTAKQKSIKTQFVDKHILDKMSYRGSHQGIIMKVKPYQYSSLKDILNNTGNKDKSLIVVLDHIKDSGNLGAIARSAEAFGADCLIIANKRAAEVTASSYKSSAGAICKIPIVKVSNITSAINILKDNEYWVAAASEHSKKNIWEENLKGKIAIVMGEENDGVSHLVLKNCDFALRLPLYGEIESLNVAQAFSACAYEWVRQNYS